MLKILLKLDDRYPIDFETMRYKVLRYISFENLQKAFSDDELYNIYKDITVQRIRNETHQKVVPKFLKDYEDKKD